MLQLAKALNTQISLYRWATQCCSFDKSVSQWVKQKDMKEEYRETSLGGLAKHFCANC